MKTQIAAALITTAVILLSGISQARMYNANTGRFQTMDTYEGNQGDPKTLHRYTYGADDPINNYDPLGLLVVNYWHSSNGFHRGIVKHSYGHLSITLNNGRYISNWPAHNRRNDDTRPPDYSMDYSDEWPVLPKTLKISGLNEGDVDAWWFTQPLTGGYSALNNNCTTTVMKALKVGGLNNLQDRLGGVDTPDEGWWAINKANAGIFVGPPLPFSFIDSSLFYSGGTINLP